MEIKRDGKTERKQKEDWPVLAICYDFDKTLSPDDMQAQGYIQSVNYNVPDFWKESNELAERNNMDQNLAYMYMMVDKAQGRVLFTREKLMEYGAQVTLFPGVEGWFERIRQYGKAKNVIVEHYIISSGLKEMIEGTSVARAGAFKEIFASSFYYNNRGVAVWPAQVVNYTGKTQYLFRIEKGVLDINNLGVNDSFAPDEIRVPFRNMVYIGDSDTDVPCMKLVNTYGGYSIGVYKEDKEKVHKMMREGRIRYYASADYTEGSDLDCLVKSIIDRTATNEVLENVYYSCRKECENAAAHADREEQEKKDLIIALEGSGNFARTHSVIKKLSGYSRWTSKEREKLCEIAIKNSQVHYILSDLDLMSFYKGLLENAGCLTEYEEKVKEMLEG